MEILNIKERINKILSMNCSIEVFLILKAGEMIIRRLDFENQDTTSELKKLFSENLFEFFSNEDLGVCVLSSADSRTNAIYQFDYDFFPNELAFINDFEIAAGNEIEFFSFKEFSLNQLSGYIIYLGNMEDGLVLYKKHYPISVIKRDTPLFHIKDDKRLVKLKDRDIIRMNGSAQAMKLDGKIYVLDLNSFEKIFGFEELIKNRAEETIKEVETIGLLEDVQVLRDSAEDIAFARKLSKIKEKSPVITLGIPNETIIRFTQTYPKLKGKFKYSNDGSKIRLDTKASKNAFVKMLNDDYLYSELTKQYYDSIAKDKVQADDLK